MLNRKILSELIKWKNTPGHKSLMIKGQRQIGKTYIVTECFSKEYDSFIYIDFIKNPEYIEIFSDSLDVESLILKLSVFIPSARFVPGKTLLLFDEIQECPRALASLKYWTKDGRYDVIGMGSALGLSFVSKESYPVGYVDHMPMYSLDFEEFLMAEGIDQKVISSISDYFSNLEKLPAVLMDRMMQYLAKYMCVGGMPEAVNAYISTRNMSNVHSVQKRLIADYRADIARFSPPEVRIKAQKCYDSVPFQLSKENHKFQYSAVESKGTATKFGTSIDWLCDQMILQKVTSLKRIDYPLEAFSDETNFRLYPTDVGMVVGAYDESLKNAILLDAEKKAAPVPSLLGLSKGGLYEALAADMLYKRGYSKLFFYKNEKNTSEIEFFITRNGLPTPIEIKAGRSKANSLTNILKEHDIINVGYKMSSSNVGKADKLVTMPLFMLMFI